MSATPRVLRARDVTGSRAWEALPVAMLDGIGVRIHWTDQPRACPHSPSTSHWAWQARGQRCVG